MSAIYYAAYRQLGELGRRTDESRGSAAQLKLHLHRSGAQPHRLHPSGRRWRQGEGFMVARLALACGRLRAAVVRCLHRADCSICEALNDSEEILETSEKRCPTCRGTDLAFTSSGVSRRTELIRGLDLNTTASASSAGTSSSTGIRSDRRDLRPQEH